MPGFSGAHHQNIHVKVRDSLSLEESLNGPHQEPRLGDFSIHLNESIRPAIEQEKATNIYGSFSSLSDVLELEISSRLYLVTHAEDGQ